MPQESVKLAQPQVYLIGAQTIDQSALDRFLGAHDAARWETDTDVAAEKLVECAGRCCYMSFAKPRPGGNAAYVGHLLEVGHGSVLEHAVFNLVITGVSRSFTHELVRHRAGMSYSQLSQRYVDESDTEFVVPPALEQEVAAAREFIRSLGQPDAEKSIDVDARYRQWGLDPDAEETPWGTRIGLVWLRAMERSVKDYADISNYLFHRDRFDAPKPLDVTGRRKAAREAARSVLPNATETKIFVTANARALRHFVEMRANAAADREIRRVAVMVLKTLQAATPNLFGDYTIEGPEGAEFATTPHAKV